MIYCTVHGVEYIVYSIYYMVYFHEIPIFLVLGVPFYEGS